MLLCTFGEAYNYPRRHRRTLKWAERGKGWAMEMIACDYDTGRGVQNSQKKARHWCGRAAEHGVAKSQFNLAHTFGTMHYNGEGGPVSMDQARACYGRAAEQGDAPAQYNLAVMHSNGLGGPMSIEHAMFWFKRSAAQGHTSVRYIVFR